MLTLPDGVSDHGATSAVGVVIQSCKSAWFACGFAKFSSRARFLEARALGVAGEYRDAPRHDRIYLDAEHFPRPGRDRRFAAMIVPLKLANPVLLGSAICWFPPSPRPAARRPAARSASSASTGCSGAVIIPYYGLLFASRPHWDPFSAVIRPMCKSAAAAALSAEHDVIYVEWS